MTATYESPFQRHSTRVVQVGDVAVGGTNPIWVQSMTTTDTHDVEATVAEILHMQEAGCELV
jgi:(E)-4-hydroxy-3-methylbut-2-enyl-diphosphate synthase